MLPTNIIFYYINLYDKSDIIRRNNEIFRSEGQEEIPKMTLLETKQMGESVFANFDFTKISYASRHIATIALSRLPGHSDELA